MFVFQKASKEKAKLRLAIFGPSGAGKTFSALRIAAGMGGRVGVVDTERRTASKYADRFDFDVLDLEQRTIDVYIAAIDAAAKAGYEILIIDSLSHAWQELLEEIDKLAKAKYKGNTWSAWSDGTPKQRKLVYALLDFPGHIIATMRSKTEWTVDSENKNKPVRVGLAPEQGKGIEYEFDLLMEISPDHVANILKDRTGKYQDVLIEKPGEKFGAELVNWLSVGVEPRERRPQAAQPDLQAENAPTKVMNGSTRPYPAEVLKAKLDERAATREGKKADKNERQRLAMVLREIFAGEGADDKRHLVQRFLFGSASLKDAPDGLVLAALHDWLRPARASSGEWVPDTMAEREARAAYQAAMLAFETEEQSGSPVVDSPVVEEAPGE